VVMLKKKGKSPSDIATNLSISTILVDQILRRLAAA
jgi:DNA-binding CsgD family transcriptional regulator